MEQETREKNMRNDVKRIHLAISLLSSMVSCGDEHSKTSKQAIKQAKMSLDNLQKKGVLIICECGHSVPLNMAVHTEHDYWECMPCNITILNDKIKDLQNKAGSSPVRKTVEEWLPSAKKASPKEIFLSKLQTRKVMALNEERYEDAEYFKQCYDLIKATNLKKT